MITFKCNDHTYIVVGEKIYVHQEINAMTYMSCHTYLSHVIVIFSIIVNCNFNF